MFLCFSGLCADQLTAEMKLSQLLAHPVTPARRAADTETCRASEKLPETPVRRAAHPGTRRASEKLPETPARRAADTETRRASEKLPETPARRAADTETRRASEKLPETPARRAADTETRRASEKLPETPTRRATHLDTRQASEMLPGTSQQSEMSTGTPPESPKRRRGRAAYMECRALCKAVSDLNPWGVAHREVNAQWRKVLERLHEEGYFHNLTNSDAHIEKLKRRVKELIQFKESPKWKTIGGEKVLADNKFNLDRDSLVLLASHLEKVAHLRDNKEKTKQQNAVKRKEQDECQKRGIAMRHAALLPGMVRTEDVVPGEAPSVADPHKKRKKRKPVPGELPPFGERRKRQRTLPARVEGTPGGGIRLNSSPTPPSRSSQTMFVPERSPIKQLKCSGSGEREIIPVAKLATMFQELTREMEQKRTAEIEGLRRELAAVKEMEQRRAAEVGGLRAELKELLKAVMEIHGLLMEGN
jgi:hypothetical protein